MSHRHHHLTPSWGKTFSFTGWKIGWASGPGRTRRPRWKERRTGCPIPRGHPSAACYRPGPRPPRPRSTNSCASDLPEPLRLPVRRVGVTGPGGGPCRRAPTSSPPTSRRSGTPTASAFCAAMAERAKVVAIPNQVFYEDGSAEGRHLIGGPSARSRTSSTRKHLPSAPCGRPARRSARP